ncbi:MAG TPA: Gfo/Idh/MocA family oxidoreductase [Bauldia sp.]|nr:Gfo/Idh/MocA family oxidoreductase [Bauldia sp.]
MDKVRVGLIGTSGWVEQMYVPSLASHPGAQVVAVCGRNPAPASAVAAKLGGAKVFSDYREMIAAGGLDAAIIVVPDDLHPAMVAAAAEARLHVLCEKPLANTLDDALAMQRQVEAAGVINMVLFTWRWQPHWRYVKHLVDRGYIGRCYRARFAFVESTAPGKGYKWRFDGRRASGAAGDLGSHMIDMAHWFFGDVARLNADLRCFVDQSTEADPPPLPVNDSALIAMTMRTGPQVLVDVSSVSYMADRDCLVTIELHGDEGTIEGHHRFLGAEAGVTLHGARRGEPRFSTLVVPDEYYTGRVAPDAVFDPYVKQSAGVRAFIDAILEGRPVSPGFADGVRVQRVLEAVKASGKEGRSVDVR